MDLLCSTYPLSIIYDIYETEKPLPLCPSILSGVPPVRRNIDKNDAPDPVLGGFPSHCGREKCFPY